MNGPSLRAVAAVSCGIGLVVGAGLVLIFLPSPNHVVTTPADIQAKPADEPVADAPQEPVKEQPAPAAAAAAKPNDEDNKAPDTYPAIQATLEARVPGLLFMNRAGGAPGMMYSDADGKFGIVLRSDDPVGTERALEKDARPGWQLCRWGKFHFVGQPEVIDNIARAAGVTAREAVPAPPPVIVKDPVPAPVGKQPPAPPERPPAEPRVIPPAVTALMERTRDKDAKEKIAALKQIATMGPGAEDACRAVCVCLLDTRREVSREALHTLEKINAEVYEPVKTLMVDNSAQRHADALARLTALGERGAGAAPVLVAYVRSSAARGGHLGQLSLAHQAQNALKEVARDDGDVIDDLLKTVRNLANTDVSNVAYQHLGFLGRAHPQHAKRIAAQCRIGLKRESDFREPIVALGRIGPAAADAVPDLQRLYDSHPNGEIRDLAGDALRRIQAGAVR